MAKMQVYVPEGNGGDYQAQQSPLLERGLYGAMFAGYSKPKEYLKYKSQEKEVRQAFRFVITHGANEQPLPAFASATRLMAPKWFYDQAKSLSSPCFDMWASLLASKHRPGDLFEAVKAGTLELPDLDNVLGWPVALMIEPGNVRDQKGVYHNNIKQFLAPSAGMRRAIGELYKAAEFEYSEDTGYRYMTSPVPAWQAVGTVTPGGGDPSDFGRVDMNSLGEDTWDGEIPF